MYPNNLRFYRQKKGITQEQLAHYAGVSVTAVQNLEYGKNKPKHQTAQNFAKALGVPAEMIFPVGGKEKGGKT